MTRKMFQRTEGSSSCTMRWCYPAQPTTLPGFYHLIVSTRSWMWSRNIVLNYSSVKGIPNTYGAIITSSVHNQHQWFFMSGLVISEQLEYFQWLESMNFAYSSNHSDENKIHHYARCYLQNCYSLFGFLSFSGWIVSVVSIQDILS